MTAPSVWPRRFLDSDCPPVLTPPLSVAGQSHHTIKPPAGAEDITGVQFAAVAVRTWLTNGRGDPVAAVVVTGSADAFWWMVKVASC